MALVTIKPFKFLSFVAFRLSLTVLLKSMVGRSSHLEKIQLVDLDPSYCTCVLLLGWSVQRWSLTFRPTSLFNLNVLGQREQITSLHMSVFICIQWLVHLTIKPFKFLSFVAFRLSLWVLLKSIVLHTWNTGKDYRDFDIYILWAYALYIALYS